MKRIYTKKNGYRLGYYMTLSFHNPCGLGTEEIETSIKLLEDKHKDDDFVYIKTPNKVTFLFKTADYKMSDPNSLNNRIERLVRPYLFKQEKLMEELEIYVESSLNNALELGMTKAQVKEALDKGIAPEKTPDLWNVMVNGYNS